MKRVVPPLQRLAPHLGGLDALGAATALARPPEPLLQAILETGADRARLVIDAYEERATTATRQAHGVFYTPPAVVEAMLDRVPLEGQLLDPAAGAGAFVVALARRLGVKGLSRITACDIDAKALDACALALEAALGADARDPVARWRRENAHVRDFLRAPLASPAPQLIVGNPPYGIVGDDDLGRLFPELRGERDLFACFLLRALAQVAPGGTVALLVPDTWLTNQRAASFREALVARSDLARVVDFGKPFQTAKDTRVHAVVLRRGAASCAVESTRGVKLERMADVSRAALRTSAGEGWFLYRTAAERRACAALERGATRLGDRFEVLYGLRTGDNARHVRKGPGTPALVGGLDLDAYDRHLAPRHLVEPKRSFEKPLARQDRRWKLGIQRIRTNSSVPWRRWVEAAPVEPREIGLDSLTLIADARGPEGAGLSDTLCALLGVLNSSVLNRWYRLTFTDVNVKPVYLARLPVPPHDPRLAALVRKRLQNKGDLTLERAVDRLVAQAYGLDDADLAVLEDGFWGEEGTRRPLPALAEAERLAAIGDASAA